MSGMAGVSGLYTVPSVVAHLVFSCKGCLLVACDVCVWAQVSYLLGVYSDYQCKAGARGTLSLNFSLLFFDGNYN